MFLNLSSNNVTTELRNKEAPKCLSLFTNKRWCLGLTTCIHVCPILDRTLGDRGGPRQERNMRKAMQLWPWAWW